MLIQSFLISLVCASDFDAVVRENPKEFSYGTHPLLQADVVELDLQVDKTATPQRDLSNFNSATDIVSQSFGLEYRMTPTPGVILKQSLKFGTSKRHHVNDGYFEDDTEDNWSQLQRTELTLQNESQAVEFTMYEEYRQVFHSEREVPDVFFKYGGGMKVHVTRNLTFSPEWSMEERTDYLLRPSSKERYGARFSWKASRELNIKPEAYTERLVDYRGQPRDRQGAGVAFVKNFPKQNLSVQVKPLYLEEHVDVGHRGNQSIERLDSSVSWKPVEQVTLRTGGIVERQDLYNQNKEVSRETVYSSIEHRPMDDFTVRVRGDYRLKSSNYEYSSYQDSSDAQMKISVSPELKLSDDLVASAQYLYEYRDQFGSGEKPEEQVLTVSLRGQF